MSKTIEAIMAHMVLPAKPRTVLTKGARLDAQWQTGFSTASGYAQRKLRLSFAPLRFDPIPKHDGTAIVRR
jgi:hypothetical protein